MSEIVERAAKAAWEEAAKEKWGFWFSGMSWDDTGEGGMVEMREAFMACTRAVIQAMHSPTRAMIEAGRDALTDQMDGSEVSAGAADVVWPRMIDVALKDTP